MDYEQHVTRDARLIILRALADQTDGRLNETLLSLTIEAFGHRRSREWVRTQLRALAELGAIRIIEAGPEFLIGELTRVGQDHVDRRCIIDGVARPSPR